MVTIKEDFPPNFNSIKEYFDIKTIEYFKPVFAYGDVVYNPYKIKIPPDMELHESVHFIQQKSTSPELWWVRYLDDAQFRFEQELEAYTAQYIFIKDNLPVRISDQALDDFSSILSSSLYNIGISFDKIKTSIRCLAKKFNKNYSLLENIYMLHQ